MTAAAALARLLALGAIAALACSGRLELDESAYLTGPGAGGSGAMKTPPPPPPGSLPPAPPPAPAPAPPPASSPPLYPEGSPAAPPPPADAAPAAPPPPRPPVADAGAPAPAPAPAPTPDPATSVCPPGVEALGLLAQRCGGCHGAGKPAKGLDLVTPGLAARVVGVKSTCMDRPLLQDGMPVTGMLLDKVEGPVAGCGAQMPFGAPPLSASERACLAEWSERVVARARNGR
jgi:hypothetical protein